MAIIALSQCVLKNKERFSPFCQQHFTSGLFITELESPCSTISIKKFLSPQIPTISVLGNFLFQNSITQQNRQTHIECVYIGSVSQSVTVYQAEQVYKEQTLWLVGPYITYKENEVEFVVQNLLRSYLLLYCNKLKYFPLSFTSNLVLYLQGRQNLE